MSFLDSALEDIAQHRGASTFEKFQKHIDPRWIEEALEVTGTATLRKRRLPSEQVVWLVLGMALNRNLPIAEVVSWLDLALPANNGKLVVAPSSISQARKRLGPEPMKWLFNKVSERWSHDSARNNEWRGLALYAIDGTSMRIPDSDVNRETFGGTNGPRGPSGYPLIRLVTLMAVRSHLLARANFGAYATSEMALTQELLPHIPDQSLTIVDRGFLAGNLLLAIEREGTERHWMTRAKSSTTWRVLQSHGRFDKLVELTISEETIRKNAGLPGTYTARAVSYRHPNSQERQWLLTSLVDPEEYPAKELVAMYHERWEIEMGYDEIKTHLLEREECIRSRLPQGVEQELWGILLTFNLIRREMENIAKEFELAPTRISFMMALRFIRDLWGYIPVPSPGAIPKRLQRMRENFVRFILPERRSERAYRREVKIKMSKYPKKKRILPQKVAK